MATIWTEPGTVAIRTPAAVLAAEWTQYYCVTPAPLTLNWPVHGLSRLRLWQILSEGSMVAVVGAKQAGQTNMAVTQPATVAAGMSASNWPVPGRLWHICCAVAWAQLPFLALHGRLPLAVPS